MLSEQEATRELVERLRAGDRLGRLIYEFNFLPLRTMHPSWAEMMFAPDLWQRLSRCDRAEAWLSRFILDQLELGETPHYDFSAPAARLALLDGDTLTGLIRRAGLALVSGRIRRAVRRDAVLAMRAALGEQDYAFAVRRALLLASDLAADDGEEVDPAIIAQQAEEAGTQALAAVLAGQPPSLVKRLMLKLPRGFRLDPGKGPPRPALLPLLLRVIKETEPRWASLFAPKTA